MCNEHLEWAVDEDTLVAQLQAKGKRKAGKKEKVRVSNPLELFREPNRTFKRKLQISSPRFPLLLFTLSNTQTHKLHYRSTSLSQDPLQRSNAANLVKLHASLLVVQDVHSTWPKVRKGNPPGSTNITSILFSNYISTRGSAITNVGKPHWQSSL